MVEFLCKKRELIPQKGLLTTIVDLQKSHEANASKVQQPRIRVCHIAEGCLWGGAESQLALLIPALVKDTSIDILVVLFAKGRLAHEIAESGINVTIFDQRRLTSFEILRQLFKYLRHASIDIVHTHGQKADVLGTVAAKMSGIRHQIRTVHGLPELFEGLARLKMAFYSYLDHLTCKLFTDAVIAVSSDIRNQLAPKYTKKQILCIHNGMDLARITVKTAAKEKREELAVPPGNNIIGTAGRLVRVKGFDYFLRAASLMLAARKDLTFIIIGEGPERLPLELLGRELHLESNVKFCGFRNDIYDLVNTMDIFVLPSLHEGTPMTILEALALGKRVVASRVGGIPEILEHEWLGRMVDPQSPVQIAQICLSLLKESSETDEVVRQRREYIRENYSMQSACTGNIELYHSMVV